MFGQLGDIAGLIKSANFPSGKSRRADHFRHPAALRLAIARSTFVQAVFWVRIAPITTSVAVFAGHQCWGPYSAKSRRYQSKRMAGVVGDGWIGSLVSVPGSVLPLQSMLPLFYHASGDPARGRSDKICRGSVVPRLDA